MIHHHRLLSNTRHRYRVGLSGEGVRSTLGYGGYGALDIVHRCLSTTIATTDANVTDLYPYDIQQARRTQARGRHFLRAKSIIRQPTLRSLSSSPLHQQLQFRYFAFDSRKARKPKKRKDPFRVLKIPKESLYKDVKTKFLKIAMSNHPDTHGDDLSDEEKDAMRDKFIEARMAFEMLAEDEDDGTAILVEEKEDRESNFDSWFRNETGLKNPFDVDIDPETMKEVAEMTEKLGGSQGMDRDGGMWALARMVTSAVKSGGDAQSILRLESGDVKGPGKIPSGSLRRPRKR